MDTGGTDTRRRDTDAQGVEAPCIPGPRALGCWGRTPRVPGWGRGGSPAAAPSAPALADGRPLPLASAAPRPRGAPIPAAGADLPGCALPLPQGALTPPGAWGPQPPPRFDGRGKLWVKKPLQGRGMLSPPLGTASRGPGRCWQGGFAPLAIPGLTPSPGWGP